MNYFKTTCLIASLLAVGTHAFAAGETEAYKLAVVDANQFVPKNGVEDKRAQVAITNARNLCVVESDATIASQAIKVSNILNKDGIFSRPVDVLEGLQAVLSGSKKKVDCTKVMAQYASIRQSVGYSHSEAIASMRVLTNLSNQLAGKAK